METSVSRTFPRTIEGLRVAIAGLPPEMPVLLGEGVEFDATTVADLRGLQHLPHRVEVIIPYRLESSTTITVNRMDEAGENF